MSLLVAFGSLFALTAPVQAAPPSTFLAGQATLEGGGAASSNISVTLYNPTTQDEVASGFSFGGGGYIVPVDPGTYEIYASDSSGGVSYSYDAIVTVPASGNSAYNFTLLKSGTCSSTISGSYNVGRTLSANNAVTPADSYAPFDQQWYRYTINGSGGLMYTTIPGATGSTYTVSDADLGYRIAYDGEQRAADGRYAFCETNDGPAAPVVGGRLAAPAPSATIGGKAKVGKKLTAQLGALAPGTSPTYQWFRLVKKSKHHRTVIKPIGGATSPVYKVKKKDRGKKVFFSATISGGGYTPSVVSSAPKKVKH